MSETFAYIRIVIISAIASIIVIYSLSKFIKGRIFFTAKTIAATGLLTAIEIVLQIFGNFIAIGPVSINLSLIPIAIGAILYGPICGLFLGFINGLAVIFAPSTLAIFMPINPLMTILLCLLKSSLAGLFAGLIYLPFKNMNRSGQIGGSILASATVPIINTGLFAVGCLLIFKPFLQAVQEATNFDNIYAVLFIAVIGWNFIFELSTNLLFSPAISRIVLIQNRKKNTI